MAHPSLLALGYAAIAWRAAGLTELTDGDRFVLRVIAVTTVASGVLVLAWTRGKHPGWIALTAAACSRAFRRDEALERRRGDALTGSAFRANIPALQRRDA